jgi:hypothetical protein
MHTIIDGKVYLEGKLVKTTVEHGVTYDEHDNVVTTRALRVKSFAELARVQPKSWLIKGVIALNEDSTWFGKDGEGKSTFVDELAIHIGSGRNWRGFEFVREEIEPDENVNEEEYRGVLIFATERADLHERRLEAYKKRDNLPENLPIGVIDDAVNLCDPDCIVIVSDTIYEFEREHNCKVGLIIIDSWSKALGGCDENMSATQNFACMNLKKIRQRHFSQFHILTVGHSGKEGSKGERGSGAKRAHVDMAVLIDGGVASIVKGNDVATGELTRFEPEEFTVIVPAYHTIPEGSFTVSILAPYRPDQEGTEARAEDFRPIGRKGEALAALEALIARSGQNGFVPLDHWKDELRRVGWIKPGDKNDRVTFKRIQDGLSQHLIFQGDFVAIKPNGKIPQPPVLCSVAA